MMRWTVNMARLRKRTFDQVEPKASTKSTSRRSKSTTIPSDRVKHKGAPIVDRIDVHHHWIPQAYRKALLAAGGDPSGWTIPNWTLQNDTEFNKTVGVSKVVFSITAPGATIDKDTAAAKKLARQMNEEAARMRDSNTGSVGFFASLPSLLDEQAAIDEIKYSLDVLKADGVTLFTRYGSGNHYLGHADFTKIWQVLNERNAVVFIHPTHMVDTSLVNPQLPQPMIDYPHETTRTAIDLVMSKTVRNNPNCRIILSHAGGTLPYLALRPAMMLPHTPFKVGLTAQEFLEDARSFYFDLALSGTRYQLRALLDFASPGHILFGSDFPYAPTPAIEEMTSSLDHFAQESADPELEAAVEANAFELFPRFRSES